MITSQNATAPKRVKSAESLLLSLITSQNATAPKLIISLYAAIDRLITSQNVTVPKLRLFDYKLIYETFIDDVALQIISFLQSIKNI